MNGTCGVSLCTAVVIFSFVLLLEKSMFKEYVHLVGSDP